MLTCLFSLFTFLPRSLLSIDSRNITIDLFFKMVSLSSRICILISATLRNIKTEKIDICLMEDLSRRRSLQWSTSDWCFIDRLMKKFHRISPVIVSSWDTTNVFHSTEHIWNKLTFQSIAEHERPSRCCFVDIHLQIIEVFRKWTNIWKHLKMTLLLFFSQTDWFSTLIFNEIFFWNRFKSNRRENFSSLSFGFEHISSFSLRLITMTDSSKVSSFMSRCTKARQINQSEERL